MVRSSLFFRRRVGGLFRLIQKREKKIETEVATRPAKRNTKARKDGPGKQPSGTQDSTNLLTTKGEREDLPRDGKTT